MKKVFLALLMLCPFFGFAQVKYKMRPNGVVDIYRSPENFETVGSIQAFDTVTLVSYVANLWGIEYKGIKGYITDVYVSDEVPGIPELKARYKKEYAAAQAQKKAKANAARAQKNKAYAAKVKSENAAAYAAKKAKYEKLYGTYTASRILNREIWIGMTEDMARHSLGQPERVNRTTTTAGVSEQWVYSGEYLYFKGGKLTSFSQHY